jgi:gliding motility-associated-like protein
MNSKSGTWIWCDNINNFHFMKNSLLSKKNLFAALALIPAALCFSQAKFPAIDVNGKRMQARAEANFTTFSPSAENKTAYERFNGSSWADHPEFGKTPYNGDFPGYVEILEKRKVNERYYVNASKPTEFKIQSALGALHFQKNGRWLTIDSRISDKGNGIYEASNQWDPVGFDVNRSLSYIKTQSGTVYFNKWALFGVDKDGNRQKLANADWSNYTAGDDGIYVRNIFPGIDASMTTRRGSIKTNFIVKQMNFGQYEQLLFKDEFVMPLGSSFKFKEEGAQINKSKGEVEVLKGGTPLLEIGEAFSYLKSDPQNERIVADYVLEETNLIVAVPVSWLKKTLEKGEVIIDPLVSSSGSLAQASITGSMLGSGFPFCGFNTSCNYNLTMNTPAQATFTDIKWSFDYLATSPCLLQDGAIKIGLGACTSPTSNSFYWYCNSPTSGTCTGANISIFSDLSSCLPAPSCVAQSVTFQLRFYRGCVGSAGCSSSCIGANSPFTIVIEGHTVEFTNLVTPITVSSNTVCAGGNISATTSVQYGVPTRTVSWQALPGPIAGGTGNTTNINFPSSGTYSIVATATDACAVTTSAQVIVTVAPVPVANAGATQSITCTNPSTVLTGSGGGTYSWTGPGAFSSANQNPTVSTVGVYSLTVNNGSCTSPASTVQVVLNNTAPSATATPASSLNCSNLTTQISINTTVSPASYTTTGPGVTAGSSTSLVTVNVGGTYNFTVTNTANGCKTASTVAVTQNTSVASVTATASNSLNCATGTATITINSSSAGVTYNTSGPGVTGGSTTSLVTVNAGGTYNYTVTNTINSCTTTGAVAVVQNTTPVTATATPAASLNCTTLSTQITINTSTTPLTYTTTGPGVTGGSSSSVVTVNTGGTYNYTVVNAFNSCSVAGTASVTQNTSTVSVSANVSNSLNCSVTSATITINSSSASVSYNTTGPGVTGGATSSIVTVNAGGTYNYTVTNSLNGCKTSSSIAVIQNTTAPSASATPASSLNCTVLSTQISITSNTTPVSYTTTGPGVTAGSSTSLVTVNTGGTYNYTVTNTANGCTFISNVSVTQSTTAPVPNITNSPTITCLTPTVTINGSPGAGVTYTWSGPGVVGSPNNANVSANASGVYSLAVTSNSNGCVSASAATVNIVSNLATPTLAMGANQTLPCNPSSVQITSTVSPGTATLVWTGPGVCAGTNSTTATACAAGVYTLTATNPGNGCSSVSTLTVNPAVGLTVSIANTGTITCNTTTVQVIVTASPSANTYSWSGPGIVGGAGTQTITVNQGGSYSVVVTNTNGCTSSLNNAVVANNAPVSVNASVTNSVDCVSNTATINTAPTPTTGSYSYTWTGPAVNGATTSAVAVSPSVNTSYTVLVMNPVNGCTATQVVNVTANTIPPTGLSVTPSSFTLSCATPTTVLTASAVGAVSYSWTTTAPGSVISGSNTANAGISGASQYTVVAIGSNGCASSAQVVTVSPNNNAPTYSLSNASPSITCFGAASVSVAITSSVPISSYVWSPTVGISGPTNTGAATFTQNGTYTAVITATNGCSSTAIINVNTNTTAPTIVAGSGTAQALSCTNSVVVIAPTFTPSSDLTYTWTGAGIVGSANNSSVQVNQAGSYSLTVTNTLTGCSTNSIVVAVTGNNIVPSLSVTSSSSMGLSCQPGTSTVSLNAVSGSTNVTYSWSNGATTQNISTSTPGTYTVTVTEGGTGCSSSATVAVQNNTTVPSLTTSASGNLPCGGGSASLNVASSPTNVTYNWSGPGIVSGSNSPAPSVNQAGTYTITVTDNITGCSSTSTVFVSQTTVSALAAADVTTGAAPLNINFSSTGSSASTYSWSMGDGNSSTQPNPSNTYTTPGTYTVVLVTSNGACSASDTLVIKVNQGLGIIPEVFTPNGDGKNETFFIDGLDNYPNAKLQVFNRWGSPVYTASPYDNKWDGTPNVSGKTGSGKLPAATYFYILELGDTDNTVFKGFIQIQY